MQVCQAYLEGGGNKADNGTSSSSYGVGHFCDSSVVSDWFCCYNRKVISQGGLAVVSKPVMIWARKTTGAVQKAMGK